MSDSPNGAHVASVPSPLPFLLDEEKHGHRQAREALFCTFNADLGFFERTILGVTQATGARVTVLADARMSAPDPRAARNAGVRYLHGLAATSNGEAFHPKVAVIVGPDRALVAIGSGNVSSGGWHLNAETWTVAKAVGECPTLVRSVASWIRTIDDVCVVAPPVRAALGRVARGLDEIVERLPVVETGHRLVHTSIEPIIDQLPDERVAHLLLYAPFHDPNAAAIKRLIERFQPDRVTLAVQPGRTVIEPAAVEKVVASLGGAFDVVQDAETRYRHGKLIEALMPDGRRWALTGSPNLSAAALLKSAKNGGNIEVGVVSWIGESLFPTGTTTTLSEVPQVAITSAPAPSSAANVLLLSAVQADEGLHVTFSRPLGADVRVEASAHADFDTWTDLGDVPEALAEHTYTDARLTGGNRVRASWRNSAGVCHGSVVFVVDTARIMSRLSQTRSTETSGEPVQLITDPRLLDMWLSGVAQLTAARRTSALPRAAGSIAPQGESDANRQAGGGLRLDTAHEEWLDYTDEAKRRLGRTLFHFALGGFEGLSAVASAEADDDLIEPTDRLIDDRAAGLDDDETDVTDDADGHPSADPTGGVVDTAVRTKLEIERNEAKKRSFRQVFAKAVDVDAHNLAAVDRLAIVQLLLCAIQVQVWPAPSGPNGWMRLLASATKSLVLDDLPDRLQSNAASLAATAVYVMNDNLPRAGQAIDDYRALTAAIAHLLPAADVEAVARYAAPLTNGRGSAVDPDDVMRVAAMVVQGDPLIDAIDMLEDDHPDWEAHAHGDAVIHVHGRFKPFVAAVDALETLAQVDPAGVWATTGPGEWAIAARSGADLIRVECGQKAGTTWHHHTLTPLITPRRVATDPDAATRSRVRHGPLNRSFELAAEVLDLLGISLDFGAPAAQGPCE